MKAKKVLAMLMASAMIMGTSVTAFAATQTTITITDPSGIDEETSVTYKYVQIVEPDPKSTIGWKFAESGYSAETETNVYAEKFKEAYNVSTAEEALNALIDDYKEGENPNSNAEKGVIHTSTDLSEALDSLRMYATNDVTDNQISASSAGLYLIIGNAQGYTFTPMLAYVEDAGSGDLEAAEVTAKGSKDQIKKDVDENSQSVSAGDTVTYTANVEYPFISVDIKNPTFEITDTLTNATFVKAEGEDLDITDQSVTIWVGGTVLSTDEYDVTFSADSEGHADAVMKIAFNYNSKYAGQDVVIQYQATVSEGVDSVDNPLRNQIESNVNENTTGYEVFAYPTTVTVTKVDQSNLNTKLDGAEITIYEEVADYDPSTLDPNVVELKVVDEDAISEDIVTETKYGKKIETLTTNEDGIVTFDGLDAQKTYFVKETKAPEGYSLNDYAYQLSGSVTSGKLQNDTDGDKYDEYVYISTPFDPETIQDTKLSSLPSTGGIGTTIFTIGGCAIMVTAAGLYFATRKKEQN